MATSAERLDFVQVPTSFISQRVAAGREYSPPIYWLALSRVRKDGHAHFASGELAELLDMDRSNVRRAVQAAVKGGWLHPDSLSSRLRCMRLPEGHGHGFGLAPGPCMLHRTRSGPRSPADHNSGGIPRDKGSAADHKSGQRVTPRGAEYRQETALPLDSSSRTDLRTATPGFAAGLSTLPTGVSHRVIHHRDECPAMLVAFSERT